MDYIKKRLANKCKGERRVGAGEVRHRIEIWKRCRVPLVLDALPSSCHRYSVNLP